MLSYQYCRHKQKTGMNSLVILMIGCVASLLFANTASHHGVAEIAKRTIMFSTFTISAVCIDNEIFYQSEISSTRLLI